MVVNERQKLSNSRQLDIGEKEIAGKWGTKAGEVTKNPIFIQHPY